METRPIGVIGAMQLEVATLIAAMENITTAECAGIVFHRGTLGGVPCVVARCGEGKVNAAACTQAMILQDHPRLVINIGIAGGIGAGVNIADLVVADRCVQYDFDSTADGTPLGAINIQRLGRLVETFPCDAAAAAVLEEEAHAVYGGAHRGTVATGDTFLADPSRGRWLRDRFDALAVEMEGGSVAQVCLMNGVPCAVLRAISDHADNDLTIDFPAFKQSSAEKSAELLRRAISRL